MFRPAGTADKKAEGMGLRLALSRKFIDLHRGRIWVTSQVGSARKSLKQCRPNLQFPTRKTGQEHLRYPPRRSIQLTPREALVPELTIDQ